MPGKTKFPLRVINADIRAFKHECELSGYEVSSFYETDPGECFYIYVREFGMEYTVKYSRQIVGIGTWKKETLREAFGQISNQFSGDGTR